MTPTPPATSPSTAGDPTAPPPAEAFRVEVPRARVQQVLERVAAYPWDQAPPGDSWQGGTSPAFLRRVCARWTGGYDWYTAQERINALGSHRARVDGQTIHFLRVTGTGRDVLPILLVPGWPSTVLDYADVVQPLADAGHDVVVAAMPGYGWSSPPPHPMGPRPIAGLLHTLMTGVLGFDRYAAGGTDFATYVAPWLALDHPEHVAGIHVTAMNVRPHGAPAGATSWPATFSAEERAFLQAEGQAQFPLLPYALVQALQGQTLSLAMVDNPVGLASWILEKHHAWTPLPDGQDPDAVFDLDRLIDTVMVYALTGSFATSILIYPGLFGDPAELDAGRRVTVPTAFADMADPLVPTPPRSLLDKAFHVVRHSTLGRGGHFAPFADPHAWLSDVVAFTDDLKAGRFTAAS